MNTFLQPRYAHDLSKMKLLTSLVVKETGRAPPPYPSIFIKPARSVTGWNENIPIPEIAQVDQLDYEGELVS